MEITCPDETSRMLGVSIFVHFAHVRRHLFAWRGPFDCSQWYGETKPEDNNFIVKAINCIFNYM